jgi:hypothetical protein
MRIGEWSFPDMDDVCREWVHNRFPDRTISILDVGAGGGKYRRLLSDYPNMDAVEIYQPYIDDENLASLYRNVFCDDIRTMQFDYYNLILMGDSLEHMTREDGVKLLNRLSKHCDDFYISVPYLNKQGNDFGDNQFEAHLQDDLTRDVVLAEYPMLQLLADNHRTGIYTRK